jgi:OOP family OmpA-OmpF porin
MNKLIALAVAAAACSTTAMAQSTGNLYGEAAYAMVTAKDTSTDNWGSFKPTLGRFTLGTVVTDNVAVEGFVTQGLSSDSKVISGANVDVKVKTGYGVAVRPFVNLSNEVELFGRIGSIRNEFEGTVSAGVRSRTSSSKTTNTLYGVGVAYNIDKSMTAVVDYTKLSNKDETSTSMVAIGVRFNF